MTTTQKFYCAACIVGTLLPYWQFVVGLQQFGLAPAALIANAASTPMGAFAWLDVLVSAVVLIAFIMLEGRRIGMQMLWVPIAATLTVGVSLGLPLFLLLREGRLAVLGSVHHDGNTVR